MQGAVAIYWNAPSQRENGEYLDLQDVGGYEIRYRLRNQANYQSVRINDAYTDSYYFDYLEGDYQFEIATFDSTGLYSRFVPVMPQ